MLKFFRTIRKKLLAENKLGNYLAYAIGEIVLVVIGILIALAINNNNAVRATKAKEQVYLAGLKSEFQTSKRKLQELIAVNRRIYEGATAIVQWMDSETPPGEKEFSEVLYNTFAFDVAFNPNNSLLNEMVHSGSLKDVSNVELRLRLTNWLSTLSDIAQQEAEQAAQRQRVLDIVRTDAYSIRTVLDQTGVSAALLGLPQGNRAASNLDILQSTAFENDLLMFILTSRATETAHYAPLMQDLDAVLDLIGRESF